MNVKYIASLWFPALEKLIKKDPDQVQKIIFEFSRAKEQEWDKNLVKSFKQSCPMISENCYVCSRAVRPGFWQMADSIIGNLKLHTQWIKEYVSFTVSYRILHSVQNNDGRH